MFKKNQISNTLFTRTGLLLGGLLIAATAAYAQPAPSAAPMGPGGPCPMYEQGWNGDPGYWRGGHRGAYQYQLQEALQLTEAQQTQLVQIAQANYTEIQALKTQMLEARYQLGQALIEPQLDKTAIAKLRTQLAELEQQLTTRMADARIQAAEVLTPEQRAATKQQLESWYGPAGANYRAGDPRTHYHWLLMPMHY